MVTKMMDFVTWRKIALGMDLWRTEKFLDDDDDDNNSNNNNKY